MSVKIPVSATKGSHVSPKQNKSEFQQASEAIKVLKRPRWFYRPEPNEVHRAPYRKPKD